MFFNQYRRPRDSLMIWCVLVLNLTACATSPNLCDGFTNWVEPARADYFPKHRIYPLNEEHLRLVEKYQPRLVMHALGTPPIDFDDYLRGAELVRINGENISNVSMDALASLSYAEQCGAYIKPAQRTVESQPPYPWYAQVFRDWAPGGDEEWLYLKYNLVFDWSGLALHITRSAQAGVNLLGANAAAKWHRLDVHVSVIIGLDAKRRQRMITITQHNYARTYLAGVEFDASEPPTVAIAARSNELYLDENRSDKHLERVVRFYNDLPYLISDEDRPRYSAYDEVQGLKAGGTPLPTRLVIITPEHPLASFAGLLAPPKRLFGRIYIGRDGPMGYDYYAPPSSFALPRGAALGYWQPGNKILLNQLEPLLTQMRDFRDEEGQNALLDALERNLADDMRNYQGLVEEQIKKN